MRDRDVRQALYSRLDSLHADEMDETRFIDELGLCGTVRVDVAVANGILAGYELKSAKDNLNRLPQQAEVYSKVLDEATLVVADRHLDHALPVIPVWWGVMVATTAGDEITRLEEWRSPSKNPAIDAYSLAQLLWRDESLDILARHRCDQAVKSKPRQVIWRRLTDSLTLDQLRAEVRTTLKVRRGWRADR